VHNEEEALGFFFMANAARAMAAHAHNSSSSRSHFIFSIGCDVRKSANKLERAVLSRLNLVDLAGSERGKKTGSVGQALKEAMFINRSLSFLEQARHPLSQLKMQLLSRCRVGSARLSYVVLLTIDMENP
jgi:kinesin family member 6/9